MFSDADLLFLNALAVVKACLAAVRMVTPISWYERGVALLWQGAMSERIDAPDASRAALSGRAPQLEEGEAGSPPPDGLYCEQTAPSVTGLSVLWRRLNEHKIVQWSVAYVALAYGIQHAAVILTSESLEWPTMVARATMLLLALGLPLVRHVCLVTHGARASRNFTQAELSIVAVAAGAELAASFTCFVRPAGETGVTARLRTDRRVGKRRDFAGGSPFRESVFRLGAGILLRRNDGGNHLRAGKNTESLRVVGRTSAFQFKGENKDLRAIGQALSATHLIEGSVRRTAISCESPHSSSEPTMARMLWTESYDRGAQGRCFAVQEEIAQAIAASLQVPLGLPQGEALSAPGP
jgi:hypothetical protein